MNRSYDIIIPVFHPGKEFDRVLSLLRRQEPAAQRILLLETLAEGDVLLSYEGCEVIPVRKEDFDHAATRRLGVSLSTADAFVMLTQDALPEDTGLCEALLSGLDPKDGGAPVAMSYARQLPREDCGVIEEITRRFNYPEESLIKGPEDVARLGIKAYFASDVCCAYDRAVYEQLGGFEAQAIFNEDMLYAAKALAAGYRISYTAEARVIHSHNYTAMEQFHRNFDNGMSQAMHPEVFAGIKSEGEGLRLVKTTASELVQTGKPWLIAKLIWQSGWKFLGFQLGKRYRRLPAGLIKAFAMNKTFLERNL